MASDQSTVALKFGNFLCPRVLMNLKLQRTLWSSSICPSKWTRVTYQVLRHVTTGGATTGHRAPYPLANIQAFHIFIFLPQDGTWRHSFRVPLLRLAPVPQIAWVCHCTANQQVPFLCVRCAVWIMATVKSENTFKNIVLKNGLTTKQSIVGLFYFEILQMFHVIFQLNWNICPGAMIIILHT